MLSKGRRRKLRNRNSVVRLATHLAVVIAASKRTTTTTSAFTVAYSETREALSGSSLQPLRQQFVSGERLNRNNHGRRRLEMVASTIELKTTEIATTSTTIEVDAITMEDVVASASIEIQKQQGQHQPRTQLQLQQHQGQHKTPFDWFEDHDKARVMESEKVGLDRLRNDDDETKQEPRGDWGGSLSPSEIVSWNDLKALMGRGIPSDSAASTNFHDDSVRLYRSFEKSGGFLVLQLDEKDASTVTDMWSTMEAYFSLPPDKQQTDIQVLEKEDGSHDPEAGYQFRQTYMNIDGEILPETIQNALKDNSNCNAPNDNDCDTHRRGIEGSYALFADITKTVGTIMAAGALEKDMGLMDKVVTSMLDDRNGHPFVNADHRLSRYIMGSNDTKRPKESLISHTDWTFTTCIPLSSIPGLQVWKPKSREWIVPEVILGGEDRTNYVVVIAGKWIELLTNCQITSCVHRVVTMPLKGDSRPRQPRLSAPFFCRTKRSIFDLVKDEFHESGENSQSSCVSSSQEQAIDSMGQTFGDWIRFLEGDRDPTIPDWVLDLCLDQEDKAPGCFSIDEILGESE
mmetsp:Transcript_41261/g.41995  ORF Transcript_41261/g.41995 Transcript_41261/m.41995 type:complete len:572 (+) Transcript_41261:74-1789(+)